VVGPAHVEQGVFEVEIAAFEDAGARWQIPFEDVGRFQFARGGATLPADTVAAYEQAARRLDRPLRIPADRQARRATLHQLATERERVRAWLGRRLPATAIDVPGLAACRAGDEQLFAALEGLMAERGLAVVEEGFSRGFVSDPRSELVKGHAIVLAELGLVAYRGKIVRDAALFGGDWSRPRRRSHVLTRLAFVSELLDRAGHPTVTLYRGAAWDRRPSRHPRGALVSATFSRAVAEDHFEGGPTTVSAALWRQAVPVERLLMTFIETRALNQRFKEAEAVLLATTGRAVF